MDTTGLLYGLLRPRINPGDYIDGDGFPCCGMCHERKVLDLDAPEISETGTLRVPRMCACERKQREEEETLSKRAAFRTRMNELRRDGITDSEYLKFTFAADDGRNAKITDVCRKYVDTWNEMRKGNIGILFYGDVGCGKSFYACAIANALLEQCVRASVTNFPRLLTSIQSFDGNRQATIDRLQKYDLLVLDDLGAERNTETATEQVYNVVDTRLRSGKPTIFTTNLTLSELERPRTTACKRIYDRVLELCPIRLELRGESRRKENAAERAETARRVMGYRRREEAKSELDGH